MKKVFQNKFCFLWLITIMVSCGHTTDDAVKFNNGIVEQQTKVFEKENALLNAINKNMQNKIDSLFTALSVQVDSGYASINEMEIFDKETGLKESSLNIFATYKKVLTGDYKDLIKCIKTPDSLYTQENDDIFTGLSKKISDTLNQSINAFIELQKKFAEKYKFELTITDKEMEKK
jgi:hypothetical protein